MKSVLIQALKIPAATALLVGTMISAQALEAYSATYFFDIDGKYRGNATRELVKTDTNKWLYQFKSSIPVVGSASQKSVFTEKDGQITPLSSQTKYKILFYKKQSDLVFDYGKKQLRTNEDGTKKVYPLNKAAYDDMSIEIKLREDLKAGKLKTSYWLADEDGIEQMKLVNHGKTTIKVPAGTFEVLKLEKKHSNPKRKTFFWIAPSLDYMPVRVMQDDKGKIYDSQLISIDTKG